MEKVRHCCCCSPSVCVCVDVGRRDDDFGGSIKRGKGDGEDSRMHRKSRRRSQGSSLKSQLTNLPVTTKSD